MKSLVSFKRSNSSLSLRRMLRMKYAYLLKERRLLEEEIAAAKAKEESAGGS